MSFLYTRYMFQEDFCYPLDVHFNSDQGNDNHWGKYKSNKKIGGGIKNLLEISIMYTSYLFQENVWSPLDVFPNLGWTQLQPLGKKPKGCIRSLLEMSILYVRYPFQENVWFPAWMLISTWVKVMTTIGMQKNKLEKGGGSKACLKEKITPVFKYQHKCEPVGLMLITMFRDTSCLKWVSRIQDSHSRTFLVPLDDKVSLGKGINNHWGENYFKKKSIESLLDLNMRYTFQELLWSPTWCSFQLGWKELHLLWKQNLFFFWGGGS